MSSSLHFINLKNGFERSIVIFMVLDEYEQSTLLARLKRRKKLKKPLRLAFLDIDSTMTGSISTTNSTRHKLEDLGFVIIYVTARTEEMLMSSIQYDLSIKLGFNRPPPKLGMHNGKNVYMKPELVEPVGLLDPDIIAGSTGTQILVRQKKGGYLIDKAYEKNLLTSADQWRNDINMLINEFNNDKKRAYIAHYDIPKNYFDGSSNVYRPKYRSTVSFQSAKDKQLFRNFVREYLKNNLSFTNIRITDDSEPRKEHFVFFLTPKNSGKRKAVDHIVKAICDKLSINPEELHVLISGDGHADFEMGMKAASGTCVTFVLPGGSRLMPALRCNKEHPELLDKDLEHLKIYFKASKYKGIYKSLIHSKRDLILCDEIEKGKWAVESVFSQIITLEKKQLN